MLIEPKEQSNYHPFGTEGRSLPSHALGILGARGSTVVSGRQFLKYGGATTSFVMETADSRICIVIDMGTGVLHHDFSVYDEVHVLFSHMHLDHILGLLYLPIFYGGSTDIHIYVPSYYNFSSFADMIAPFLSTPYFPVVQASFSPRITMHNLDIPPNGDTSAMKIHEVEVLFRKGNHPGGCVMFRLNVAGKGSHCFTGDYEHSRHEDTGLIEFARGTDFLIYDSSYTQSDYIARHIGWGHSTHEHAASIAREACVGYLILSHHDYTYSDSFLDSVLHKTRQRFPNTCFAYTGLYLELQGDGNGNGNDGRIRNGRGSGKGGCTPT